MRNAMKLLTVLGGGGEAAPEAPANLTITGIDGDSVVNDATPEFTWDAVDGADTYTLQYDDDIAFGSPVEVTDIAVTNYTPSALTGAKRYARVRGVNAGGNGAWSDTLTFIIPYIYDSFTAADATNVNGRTPDITTAAATWGVLAGSYSIVSNRALSGASVATATIETGQSDIIVECTCIMGDVTTTNNCQLLLRASDALNGWLLSLTKGSQTFDLNEWVAGVATPVASTPFTLVNNQVVELRVVLSGQSIVATADGANQISYGSAASNLTVTKHGIRAVSTGTITTRPRFDNFRVSA